MTNVYDTEREVPQDQADALRGEIQAFISQYHVAPTFLLTFRKDGRPVMRPVATFVEGWTIHTITQDKHVKTQHLRRNPMVGYLWVGREGMPGQEYRTKSVFVQGRAQLTEKPDEIAAFFERRRAATGVGDAHPHDMTYKRILATVTPEYLRAEGFADAFRPVIIRDFSY